ncbi:glycine cleavage system H protein [Myxococcus xanthus DK 1622]|uniref:Glycine cleavage system H protein n=1 Tax=Myxococcus xanthus (strain DK1622) TaxID=246197 RepID=GCSH_MYXXD|nr:MULTISPECIES: glycine cleavage system protein GcvH [Myxococcus]Q1D7X3.1 RecName: Full=Glycine cleavage system H protein [Myxococcus xanthus DK 1622]ABF90620.1 glycine cleavage system H protein [Myxococcus xanthus DK 1622]NOJ55615.1 glycine cleavage system protein GcvH [Myxococcus xanthus]QPM82510.1 glycine cleavage system protein GcvH [Myxococcus xanthus]QVW64815.1 glycine cleavage system protein GcvH [Myxococcus xanthus DZ2]QZZ50758.1 Glycine cleavage system H protein [Myxococcus xanthus]
MADNIPGDLKYTREHEWARVQGTSVVVGVTQHAQESLGDVVYVELPKVGSTVTEGKQFGVIESTKAVSELYSPLTGKVVKVNDGLSDNPSTVNTDPYGAGWIVEIEPSDPKQVDGLMDAAAYTALLQNS